ncbi:MAG: glycosyltransferase [Candidatus Rokuibacteriota bacterium]
MTQTTTDPDAAAAGAPADAPPPAAASDLPAQIERAVPCDIAVALLTYNNAATALAVAAAARAGIAQHCPAARAALVNVDAGSSDGTPDSLAAAGLPAVCAAHDAPLGERARVPFHGVPGRGGALRQALEIAQRLGARALLVLEADVTSITDAWVGRLLGPVGEQRADLALAAYARHRYDGTITNLLLAPLIRALYGRRLRQPLGGAQALSARLVDHLLLQPPRPWAARDLADLWIVGTAIADGFAVCEAWVGRRRIESRTRTTDLPAMVAQTLGAVFTVMDRHHDLWLDVRGSEPLPSVGEPLPLGTEPVAVDVDRMIGALTLGLRDLGPLWEQILAPETLADVLDLDAGGPARFTFPDDVWARVVYDFALAHHYGVAHRDHLLRSLVPLYLGRTAAFVLATRDRDAAATETALDAVGRAFERQKPYLVERWR